MSKNLVAVEVIGGLGNQMFQYAFGLATARRLAAELVLDLRGFDRYEVHAYGLDAFRWKGRALRGVKTGSRLTRFMQRPTRTFVDQLQVKTETGFSFDPVVERWSAPLRARGYWQAPAYFNAVEAELRESFELRKAPGRAVMTMADRISATESICLHVRRGDYVSNPEANAVHGTMGLAYYESALEVARSGVKDPTIYVFSDDLDWAMREIRLDAPMVAVNCAGPGAPHEDLWLMSRCKSHIIANSTFSWWGAWLGKNPGQRVVAPKNWFRKPDLDTRDLFPASWTLL